MEDHNVRTGYNNQRLKDRAIDELIGICRGILFDGCVSTGEAEHLVTWLNANPAVAEDWFGRDLHKTLTSFLEDGVIDEKEESALLKILIDITGRAEVNLSGVNAATTLPLCQFPPVEITIDGFCFALTGNFAAGKRKDVEQFIKERGGEVKKNASKKCHYLIIGEVGSSAWMHSTFGRKIEEAVNTRDKGHPIFIISESHFFASIDVD